MDSCYVLFIHVHVDMRRLEYSTNNYTSVVSEAKLLATFPYIQYCSKKLTYIYIYTLQVSSRFAPVYLSLLLVYIIICSRFACGSLKVGLWFAFGKVYTCIVHVR